MPKTKILVVFGTRPEAIKMAPLVKEVQKYPERFELEICVTGQHREMLDQVLEFFEMEPTYDLNLMKKNQALGELTGAIIHGLTKVLRNGGVDVLCVQGDTTTAFAAALAGFYENVKVAHVEAGLRTYNKQAPFPEEINRQLISRIADFHFAPTQSAKEHLLSEGIKAEQIWVTGNTVIDALLWGIKKLEVYSSSEIDTLRAFIQPQKKIILVTGHRRESFGAGFEHICQALLEISKRDDVQIVYPVHLNPNVQEPVHRLLGNRPNIHLISPLNYPAFIWLMNQSYMLLTDSGGVQEEAPSLGKPVFVMRNTTERMEAVEAGVAKLVGTQREVIIKEVNQLLNDSTLYNQMSGSRNPYGEGVASQHIVSFLTQMISRTF